MFNSIKSKIFFSHLFLIVLLLLSLSYKHYLSSIDNYINNMIAYHTNSSSSIITTSSLAISGANYGNIQLPSFIKEVLRNKKLLYMNISGNSDYSSKYFNAIYNKNDKTIYRNQYPQNYEKKLNEKLKDFITKLNNPIYDKVKMDFLIKRIDDKLHQYKRNIKYKKNLSLKYIKLLKQESTYVDFDEYLLHISLKTNNKNGGKVSMIFDMSEIRDIKIRILEDLFVEIFLALLFSIILLTILSNKIVAPLNNLSKYLSTNFKDIDINKMPEASSKDEIGVLSRIFKKLLKKLDKKQKQIEAKAYFDSLTGVYNRHMFNEIFNDEFKRTQRYSHNLSLALIDIDNFKKFNDTYGHLIGDEVLIMVANILNKSIRNSDTFARWGGEEFVIVFVETSATKAKIIAEKLKDKIQELKHKEADSITASFGITQYMKDDTIESIFKRCDDALYLAKANGKNIVEVL